MNHWCIIPRKLKMMIALDFFFHISIFICTSINCLTSWKIISLLSLSSDECIAILCPIHIPLWADDDELRMNRYHGICGFWFELFSKQHEFLNIFLNFEKKKKGKKFQSRFKTASAIFWVIFKAFISHGPANFASKKIFTQVVRPSP